MVQNRLCAAKSDNESDRFSEAGVPEVSGARGGAERPAEDHQLHFEDVHTRAGAEGRLPAAAVASGAAQPEWSGVSLPAAGVGARALSG